MITLSARDLDAALLDLDGVLTNTADHHAEAWKSVFDELLEARGGGTFTPFDIATDYPRFVDGRLRQDGAYAFLASRGIELPFGAPSDQPGAPTIWGLGNRKNQLFREIVRCRGVQVYRDARRFVEKLTAAGIATAIVSASKNCGLILERAQLVSLFDAVIDGNEAQRLNLRGKPHPDTFLAAARELDVEPRYCAVIEDASSGIEAARKGGFGLVIGVERQERTRALRSARADAVVADLTQIEVRALPSALSEVDAIFHHLVTRPHAVFLDYDGTLTPIAPRPEMATLSASVRVLLAELNKICPVGIVSGRQLAEIEALVGLDIAYAASHGLEIKVGHGEAATPCEAQQVVPAIRSIAGKMRQRLAAVSGVLIEEKPYSVAVHYRLVPEAQQSLIATEVERALAAHSCVRLLRGKKVFEFRPDIEWDKGQAVLALAKYVGASKAGILYIGDDVTDEDVFRLLRHEGIGIVVAQVPRRSTAAYTILDTTQVAHFLSLLTKRLAHHANE